MKKTFSIWVSNIGYYSEGNIVGEWIDLPQTPEKIKQYLKDIVKIDKEHEEYEVADTENYPFVYESIQWANIYKINDLAIIYSELTEEQKEKVLAYSYTLGDFNWSIDEIINVCLQADNIEYYRYDFDDNKELGVNGNAIKMGYTMAKNNGIFDTLEKLQITSFFNFEKYGESFGYDYELLDNGYLNSNNEINYSHYSENEIKEKIDKILNMKKEEIQIEI